MISYNNDFAIDLSQVKAIKIEYLRNGGNLIFEFNNLIIPVEDEESGKINLQSFKNDPVVNHFDDSDSLRVYFDEWVDMWQDRQK